MASSGVTPSVTANSLHSSSFRVENRCARPKIVQNVIDQGNAFFSKQANILNTSHKRHRRGVTSPGTEFLFLSKNEQILNQSSISDHRQQLASGAASSSAATAAAKERDQFNFTFFREKSSTPGLVSSQEEKVPSGYHHNGGGEPLQQILPDSHINVSSLISSAQGQKRTASNANNLLAGFVSSQLSSSGGQANNLSHLANNDGGFYKTNKATTTTIDSSYSTKDYYQNFINSQLHHQQAAESGEEEIKTPGIKYSNGYPQF